MVFFYLPLVVLVIYSFNEGKAMVWQGFSLKWYKELFMYSEDIWRSFKYSIFIAIFSGLLSTALGTLGAIGLHWYKFRYKKYLEVIGYLPLIVPDIIMGVSLLILFVTVRLELGLASIFIVHTTFNILCTLLLFPFANQLEKLACIIIKDAEKKESLQLLDERLMTTPAIAIDRCKKVVMEMFEKTIEGVSCACDILSEYDSKVIDKVKEYEEEVDKYEDKIGTYLVRISTRDLSESDSKSVSELLHIIGDIERISDHSVGIAKSAEEIHDKKLHFSENARKELKVLINAVKDILNQSQTAFENNDMDASLTVEALEEVIDHLKHQLKKRHIDRLKNGKCTIEQGFIMTDILTSLERISDHCSNIAGCVEEIDHDSLGLHAYSSEIDKNPGSKFYQVYTQNKDKYAID